MKTSKWAVLTGLLVLAACGGPGEPIRVGLVSNQTGRSSDTGIDARNGVQLAVEEINAAGGVKGRKIELLIKDDEGKAESAKKAMQELIDARVVAVIGNVVSGMTQASLPLANEKKMLMLSPTSVSNIFTGKDDYLIRTSPAAKQATVSLARFARNKLGLSRVAAIYDLSNKGYSEDWFKSFKESFEGAGGRIADAVTYTTGQDKDYSALAQKLLAAQPDGIVLISGAVDTALLSQQIRKINDKLPLIVAGWAMTDELLVKGGKAVESAYLAYNFDKDSRAPAYLAFRESYRKRFGSEPGFAAKFGYETVGMLKAGMEKAAALDSDGLKKAIIAQGSFTGLQGDFKIDAYGDAEAQVLLFTVKDGVYRRVL